MCVYWLHQFCWWLFRCKCIWFMPQDKDVTKLFRLWSEFDVIVFSAELSTSDVTMSWRYEVGFYSDHFYLVSILLTGNICFSQRNHHGLRWTCIHLLVNQVPLYLNRCFLKAHFRCKTLPNSSSFNSFNSRPVLNYWTKTFSDDTGVTDRSS